MTRDIRKESGMMLIRRPGFHLLNLEKLLEKHPKECCRQLKRPELVQWNDSKMFVLEAKSSPLGIRKDIPSENLKAAAEAQKCSLLSPFDQFRSDLYGKFISALVCMGEDGKHAVIQSHHDLKAYVDDVAALEKLRLLSSNRHILLVLLIPKISCELAAQMQNSFNADPLIKKIRAFLPCCEINVINASGAARLKLARCL